MQIIKNIKHHLRQAKTKRIADKLEVLFNEKELRWHLILKEFYSLNSDLELLSLIENFGFRAPWDNPWRIEPISLQRTLIRILSKDQILDLNLQLERQGLTKRFVYSLPPINQ